MSGDLRLRDLLGRNDASRVAVISDQAELTFGDLLSGQYQASSLGARVLLAASDTAFACQALVALDGAIENIFISSANVSEQMNAEMVVDQEITAVVSDAELSLSAKTISTIEDAGEDVAAVSSNWIMSTSGTSGKPKLVAQNLSSLTRTVRSKNNAETPLIWGMLYDYSRFAGMQVLLQSLIGGGTLVAPSYDWPIDKKLEFFVEHGVTSLSATPSMWRKLLMSPFVQKLALQQVTLGGEIADQAILDSLKRAFPDARITHIFASTEAGVGFAVNDGKSGFPISLIDAPQKGIEIKIENDYLFVRNPLVAGKYFDSDSPLAEDGWVKTGDIVNVADDRVFFKGRESGIINVGGNKINPEEVEAALLSLSNIAIAHVYGKANPILGALVIADVVLKEPVDDLASEKNQIIASVVKLIGRDHAPAIVNIVESLELNCAGKIERAVR